jgi:hypothetical protein
VGEERSPFPSAVHDARPATNLNSNDKLCIWPGQKPHTSKQVLAGFELLLEWKKEDRNCIKLLVGDISIVLL